jgi:hypothetical protein
MVWYGIVKYSTVTLRKHRVVVTKLRTVTTDRVNLSLNMLEISRTHIRIEFTEISYDLHSMQIKITAVECMCTHTHTHKFTGHINRIFHQESPRKSSRFGIEWDTSAVGLC